MIWCILIPLLTGLICGILGYAIGKLSSNDEGNAEYIKRITALETDLEYCRSSKGASAEISGNESVNFVSSDSKTSIAVVPFNSDLAKSVFGKKIKENDLTVVEGIGPKISELFNNTGVDTWQALAECSVAKCQEVLNSGGKRFEIHKPGSWPDQAKMAAEGNWQGLKDWQDKLDGGK
jgi:predicted flap endonuclease-1-like 5' DNA nuclease